MKVSTSKLRENIYRILDEVAERGVTVRVERKGRTVRIEREEQTGKLSRLARRRYLRVDPEELVHLDWSHEWRP
ncbi:MAG: type II toxin-antitoxin system Phd/YefM family antitoxin [Deltaproteobacteria bacterium]|nr:type II toxin-antitoxin system Phd/YefM family antitoxin [Deltaproteobacteria bacterium]